MVDSVRSRIVGSGIRDALRVKSICRGRPLIGPKAVNIHVINSCNYRCEFCWYFSPLVKSKPKRRMIDYKVLESVIEDCHEIGVDEINLEGGEVTLYPYWTDAFSKVRELGMRLGAYTHLGYDKKYLPGLRYADRLTVNFSAMTEESFRRVHGKTASMARVLRNLDILLAMRGKYGKPKIVLSFVVYQHNYKELADFLDMAQNRRVDQVVIRFFEATEEMRGLFFSKESLAALHRTVRVVLEKSYTYKHDLTKLNNLLSEGRMFDNIISLSPSPMHNDRLFFYDSTGGRTRCYVGWFSGHIDEQGRVVAPCDNVGVCVAGNINERRFKDIWLDNDFLHATLKEASEGIDTCSQKWQECRYCSYGPMNKMLDQRVRAVAEA